MTHPTAADACAFIKQRAPQLAPKIGLILGSGLGSLADQIENAIKIPYSDIPGFPVSSVTGHSGQLILGTLNKMPVACLQGRVHFFEGITPDKVKILIRTLHLLGCTSLIITNSSGSIRSDVGPGELMLITDHINFQPGNPLVGINDEEFGPRFVSMDNAYDHDLRLRIMNVAEQLKIGITQGVYISVLGPVFETPAEIRAFRILGADAVGMSTVPEVVVARHCGMRVAAIAGITNYAAGMSEEILSHEGTLHHAQFCAANMSKLITALMENLQHDS